MGWLFIIVLVVLLVIAVRSYNSLQRLSQEVRETASNVQVAISKKLTLINQLIDVVKNYQEGEQFVQLKVSQEANATALMSSYQQSGNVLASLQGVADRFPNLKANEQYTNLTNNIRDSELGIQASREKYNSAVKSYNSVRNKIPTVFVARFIGFSEAPYLEFDLSGVKDVTSLKDFKTDDGERLHQLLSGAGNKISEATKAIAGQAGQAGKVLADKMKDKSSETYFYMAPGGVPKGPHSLNDIKVLVEKGNIPADSKIAVSGSDDWKNLDNP
jgi:LemA protein